MKASDKIEVAEIRVGEARARLIDGLVALRDKLSPTAFAGRVTARLKSKSGEVLEDGVEAVREHRWAAAGVATLAGLVLARKPIAALLQRDETTAGATGLSEDHQETET